MTRSQVPWPLGRALGSSEETAQSRGRARASVGKDVGATKRMELKQ